MFAAFRSNTNCREETVPPVIFSFGIFTVCETFDRKFKYDVPWIVAAELITSGFDEVAKTTKELLKFNIPGPTFNRLQPAGNAPSFNVVVFPLAAQVNDLK